MLATRSSCSRRSSALLYLSTNAASASGRSSGSTPCSQWHCIIVLQRAALMLSCFIRIGTANLEISRFTVL